MDCSYCVILLLCLALDALALPAALRPTSPSIEQRDTTWGTNQSYVYIHEPAGLTPRAALEPCPERPSDIDEQSICGSQFRDMEHHGWGPALASMPVFLFAREDSNRVTCYPESALVIGSSPPRPNPGTLMDWSMNPGNDCTDPGRDAGYTGDMTWGRPFPVYVDAIWSPSDESWRINYNIYFVHDYNQINDWEFVSVIWKKSPTGKNWFYRSYVWYSQHSDGDMVRYDNLVSVDAEGTGDVSNMTVGLGKKHPKVFVGMYKHALFPTKYDDCHGAGCVMGAEYRSSDYWYLPGLADIHHGALEIPREWEIKKRYGRSASGLPTARIDQIRKKNVGD